MTDLFIIIFLFLSIVFAVIVELSIKKGKLKRVDTYSYKTVIKTTMRLIYVAIVISLVSPDSNGVNDNSNKNIYNSRDKMNKIITHCKDNSIEIEPDFIKRLPSD